MYRMKHVWGTGSTSGSLQVVEDSAPAVLLLSSPAVPFPLYVLLPLLHPTRSQVHPHELPSRYSECESVVRFVECFEDRHAVHIVMELCSGGELFERIIKQRHYSERAARDIIRVIFQTISYMHQLGVMHRDLKPENFLFMGEEGAEEVSPHGDPGAPGTSSSSSMGLKLTDFGLSVLFKPGERLHDTLGSELYAAPEVWSRVVPDSTTGAWRQLPPSYGPKADVWSCGVILYILLSGSPPYQRSDQAKPLALSESAWQSISDDAKDLVRRLLHPDPDVRPTATEVLKHAWLQSGSNVSDWIRQWRIVSVALPR
jgi:calcium-dependent protein kinase